MQLLERFQILFPGFKIHFESTYIFKSFSSFSMNLQVHLFVIHLFWHLGWVCVCARVHTHVHRKTVYHSPQIFSKLNSYFNLYRYGIIYSKQKKICFNLSFGETTGNFLGREGGSTRGNILVRLCWLPNNLHEFSGKIERRLWTACKPFPPFVVGCSVSIMDYSF